MNPRAFLLNVLVLLAHAASGAAAGTLYDELEIRPDATPKQVREAFRRLALKHHPDKARFADSTARFIRISEAYDTLSSPEKRASYDAMSRRHSYGSHSSGGSGSGSSRGGGGGAERTNAYHPFSFTFSLKDAFATFERFIADKLPGALGERYQLAKAALSAWPGFEMPLPELLQSRIMRETLDSVDWVALGTSAEHALRRAFGTHDGGVDWLKVAGASAAGATAVASALDAIDDGNRTATLLDFGSKALSWLHKAGASYGQPKEEA